jgi:hypothetical protein
MEQGVASAAGVAAFISDVGGIVCLQTFVRLDERFSDFIAELDPPARPYNRVSEQAPERVPPTPTSRARTRVNAK